jgi:predicted dienelactone hydrolase
MKMNLQGWRAWALQVAAAAIAMAAMPLAWAGMGQLQLGGDDVDGRVTVFYPSAAPERPEQRGRFKVQLAVGAEPVRGNGRLVVVSHGSGGSPWVHTSLARTLVDAGYVVAFPWHHADNSLDPGRPGPDSWALRPAEVSKAIDAVAADGRLAPLLALDRVGVYGMSAGGHTALSLAGGRWARAGFKRHCLAHLEADFPFCVGLITRLDGGALDGLKKGVARVAISLLFSGEQPQAHDDPRVAAVVAGVPAAADFDLSSLARPRVPLGLVIAAQDRWLAPRFHARAVLAACLPCEVIADLPDAGHGALLSPLPGGLTGTEGDLLNDPPGFDRSRMGDVDRLIAAFFDRHLGNAVLNRGAPGSTSVPAILADATPVARGKR